MAASTKRILIPLSSASQLVLKNGKKVNTGFFLSELMVPVQKLKEHGCRITYANITGTQPSMDPMSDSSIWFGMKQNDYKQAKDTLEFELLNTAEGGLKNPMKFSDLQDDVQLQTFDAIFVPGGHAPVMDLPLSLDLGRILLHFHDNKKPTAMICHGPVSILSTALHRTGDKFPYLNYHMTCYSDAEEGMNEMMWFDKVPLHIETELKHLGCIVNNRFPMMPNVIVDEELITGQGPTSVWRFADTFISSLGIKQ